LQLEQKNGPIFHSCVTFPSRPIFTKPIPEIKRKIPAVRTKISFLRPFFIVNSRKNILKFPSAYKNSRSLGKGRESRPVHFRLSPLLHSLQLQKNFLIVQKIIFLKVTKSAIKKTGYFSVLKDFVAKIRFSNSIFVIIKMYFAAENIKKVTKITELTSKI